MTVTTFLSSLTTTKSSNQKMVLGTQKKMLIIRGTMEWRDSEDAHMANVKTCKMFLPVGQK